MMGSICCNNCNYYVVRVCGITKSKENFEHITVINVNLKCFKINIFQNNFYHSGHDSSYNLNLNRYIVRYYKNRMNFELHLKIPALAGAAIYMFSRRLENNFERVLPLRGFFLYIPTYLGKIAIDYYYYFYCLLQIVLCNLVGKLLFIDFITDDVMQFVLILSVTSIRQSYEHVKKVSVCVIVNLM